MQSLIFTSDVGNADVPTPSDIQVSSRGANVGIRIRPEDIEVPEDDPFKNDLSQNKR